MKGTEFGALMRRWRTERSFSLGGVALRAGISKAALSRWESGTRQPSMIELEAVLDAFDIPQSQRIEAFRLLDAPRSVRRLRDIDNGVGPPVNGDLLRALRLRKGLTQTEVAEGVGVRQGTLAKWERSDDWPSADRLAALGVVLRAGEEEMSALATGRFLPPIALSDADSSSVVEASEERLRLLRNHLETGVIFPGDLNFMSLEAALWAHTSQSNAAMATQAEAYALHAIFLMREMRSIREVITVAGRALELGRHAAAAVPSAPLPSSVLIGVILSAGTAACQARRITSTEAVRRLQPYVAACTPYPSLRTWILWELALLMAFGGNTEEALRLADQAATVPDSWNDPSSICFPWARYYQASVFFHTGLPDRALEGVSFPPPRDPYLRVRLALLASRTCFMLSRHDQAVAYLQEADSVIESLDLIGFRPEAEAIRLVLGDGQHFTSQI